jgi:hypothetical protein
MKPSNLAVLIALYAFAGILLSLATHDGTQWLVATFTAVTLAFTLGASWPVHRNFAITGLAIGIAFAAAMFSYIMFALLTEDFHGRYQGYRARLAIVSVFYAFTIFGGWTFFVGLGAGTTWLARQLRRVPSAGSLA